MRFSFLFILVAFVALGCQSTRPKANVQRQKSNTVLANSSSQALNKKNLVAELTGKKAPLVKSPIDKLMIEAKKNANQNQYARALRIYSFVATKFPQSAQARTALVEKALIYQKMGLAQPAQLNAQRAQIMNRQKVSAKNNTQMKVTK